MTRRTQANATRGAVRTTGRRSAGQAAGGVEHGDIPLPSEDRAMEELLLSRQRPEPDEPRWIQLNKGK